MVSVHQAIRAAEDYLANLGDELGMANHSMQLEEVELAEDESHWLITLSYLESRGLVPRRTYKALRVDADGTVRWMRIRQLEDA